MFARVTITVLTAIAIILAVTIAGMFLARAAHADVLVKGKVYKTTADKIIADRQLVCSYAKPRFEALPDGRTVIINGKVCIEVSR